MGAWPSSSSTVPRQDFQFTDRSAAEQLRVPTCYLLQTCVAQHQLRGPRYNYFDSTFGKYIPFMVRQYFAQMPKDKLAELQSPSIQRFDAAIAFVDISGFTKLSESLVQKHGKDGAELLNKHISSYFSKLIDVIVAFGGDILKFAGDAMLVIWRSRPAEVELKGKTKKMPKMLGSVEEPLAALALRAAACCLSLLSKFNNYVPSAGVTLRLHTGIGAGSIVSLFVGGVQDMWEFFVGGEPIAQMAAAGQEAKSGEVLLSPACYVLVAGACTGRKLESGNFNLKAIPDPPRLFRVVQPPIAPELESVLSGFIPPIVRRLERQAIATIASEPSWLAEFRRVVIMFIKLPSVDYQAPGVLQHVQRAVKVAQESVLLFEGTVARLLADDKGTRFKILFGMPTQSFDDNAVRCIRCALEIRNQLRLVGHGAVIGIACGTVFCGQAGSHVRCEYTAVGFKVNLAARLMMAAEKRGSNVILCDEETYMSAKHVVTFDVLPSIPLKGVQVPVAIFQPITLMKNIGDKSSKLLGITGAREERKIIRSRHSTQNEPEQAGRGRKKGWRRHAATLKPSSSKTYAAHKKMDYRNSLRSSKKKRGSSSHLHSWFSNQTLFGRAHEKKHLTCVLNSVMQTGETAVVIVDSEAGLGKTALIADFLVNVVDEMRLRFVYSIAEPLEKRTPYYAWKNIFFQLLDIESVRQASKRRAAVEKFFTQEDLHVASLFNSVLHTNFVETNFVRSMTVEAKAESMQKLLTRVLYRTAIDRKTGKCVGNRKLPRSEKQANVDASVEPRVLVIEDLHWFDSGSWELAVAVANTVPGLFILLSTRPLNRIVNFQKIKRYKCTTTLSLAELSPKESCQHACSLLHVSHLPRAVRHLILDRAKGNPLYVEELCRLIVEENLATVRGNRLVLAKNYEKMFNEFEFPDSIQAAITNRIDRLPVNLQITLKVCSVIGSDFFRVDLLRLIHPGNCSSADLRHRCKRLVEAGLFSEIKELKEVEERKQPHRSQSSSPRAGVRKEKKEAKEMKEKKDFEARKEAKTKETKEVAVEKEEAKEAKQKLTMRASTGCASLSKERKESKRDLASLKTPTKHVRSLREDVKYKFQHAYIRDAAYKMLSIEQRTNIHLRIGWFFEKRFNNERARLVVEDNIKKRGHTRIRSLSTPLTPRLDPPNQRLSVEELARFRVETLRVRFSPSLGAAEPKKQPTEVMVPINRAPAHAAPAHADIGRDGDSLGLEGYYALLAHHFERARDWKKTVRYKRLAGRKGREAGSEGCGSGLLAIEVNANHEALKMFQAVADTLSVHPRQESHRDILIEAQVHLGNAFFSMGRYHQAINTFEKALDNTGFAFRDKGRLSWLKEVSSPSIASTLSRSRLHTMLKQRRPSATLRKPRSPLTASMQSKVLDVLDKLASAYCFSGRRIEAGNCAVKMIDLATQAKDAPMLALGYARAAVACLALRLPEMADDYIAKSKAILKHGMSPCAGVDPQTDVKTGAMEASQLQLALISSQYARRYAFSGLWSLARKEMKKSRCIFGQLNETRKWREMALWESMILFFMSRFEESHEMLSALIRSAVADSDLYYEATGRYWKSVVMLTSEGPSSQIMTRMRAVQDLVDDLEAPSIRSNRRGSYGAITSFPSPLSSLNSSSNEQASPPRIAHLVLLAENAFSLCPPQTVDLALGIGRRLWAAVTIRKRFHRFPVYFGLCSLIVSAAEVVHFRYLDAQQERPLRPLRRTKQESKVLQRVMNPQLKAIVHAARTWDTVPQIKARLLSFAHHALESFKDYSTHFPFAQSYVKLLQGRYHWLNKKYSKAFQSWEEALQGSRKLCMPYLTGLVEYQLGSHVYQRGGFALDRAVMYSRQARRRLNELGVTDPRFLWSKSDEDPDWAGDEKEKEKEGDALVPVLYRTARVFVGHRLGRTIEFGILAE